MASDRHSRLVFRSNLYEGPSASAIIDSTWVLEDVAVGEYFVALLHDRGLFSGAGKIW